ncbi:C-C motif chemokine 4, partial [Clarias magur]
MSSRSLLMGLLVLTCLQSFTTAQNSNGVKKCCFTFSKNKIPLQCITQYIEARRDCTKPGI